MNTKKTVLHNGYLVTPHTAGKSPGHLIIEAGRIAALGAGPPPNLPGAIYIDANGGYIGPGFIDVHVHGANGHDTMDAAPEALYGMARFKARHGVTAFVPTTITDTPEALRDALANIGACEGPVKSGAAILGAHVEGPYLSAAKKGAQPEAYIRPADPEEYTRWFELCTVRVVTLAVEELANLPLIAYARAHGAAASVGHSSASYEEVYAALDWGLCHVTHTYNGMSGLHHRKPGVVLAALSLPALYSEIVCDLHHVHPAMIAHLVRAKTPARTVLITDAIRATGLPDGEYALGKQRTFVKDGLPRTPEGSIAGSSLTMDRALRNMQYAAGVSLAEAWHMASLTPAESIGVVQRKGSLAVGKDADIAVLDTARTVSITIAGGEVVYRRG